jgi:hypothetical protein
MSMEYYIFSYVALVIYKIWFSHFEEFVCLFNNSWLIWLFPHKVEKVVKWRHGWVRHKEVTWRISAANQAIMRYVSIT